MSTTLPNDTFAPTATEPLFGRGAEYEAVLSFVQDRLTLTHCKSLFVFGACGTGKTSTVLRALRAVSDRVMSLDKPQRTMFRSRKTPRRESDALDANWEDASEVPMPSRASVLLTKHPRLDVSYAERTPRNTTVRSSSSTSSLRQTRSCNSIATTSGKTGARCSSSTGANTTIITHMDSEATDSVIEKYTMPYFTTRYATLFAPKPTTRSSTRGLDTYTRRVQGHYVNCADLSAAALIAAILESLRVTYPRPDAEIRALREAIEQLGQTSASPCRTSAAVLDSNERLSRRSTSTLGRRSSGRRSSSTKTTNEAAVATNALNGTPSRSSVAHAALQVIVLDEVEYARPAARATISALATLSATSQHAMLALIFISNQRDLVHVPQMLLHELPFQAYSVATLRYIAERCITAEVSRLVGDCEVDTTPSVPCATRRTRTSTTRISTSVTTQPAAAAAGMQISPSLYEYIARKALLDFSGDVRQVCAMCRHVVRGALGTSQTSNTTAQSRKESEAAVTSTTQCNSASVLSRDTTTLTSLVDTYEAARMSTTATHADTPSINRASTLSSSTLSSLSTTGSSPAELTSAQQQRSAADQLNTSPSSTSPAAASSSTNSVTVKPCTTITLASSVAALKQNAVEEQLHQHVATMPEQMLYVLCCLIVLTLRNVQLHTQAITAIGGCPSATSHRTASSRRVSSSSSSSRNTTHGTTPMSTSLKVREVHQLYTALMGQRHFPSMNGAGVRLAIDGLADLGILTRPQRRGNEEMFSFNGVWSVTAVQAALAQRGEALRREMAACGLDGSENKFVTVLCDLKSLAHVTQ